MLQTTMTSCGSIMLSQELDHLEAKAVCSHLWGGVIMGGVCCEGLRSPSGLSKGLPMKFCNDCQPFTAG